MSCVNCDRSLDSKDFALPFYLIFSFYDCFKQALFGAIEGQAATQEDEDDDSAAPNIHRFPVGFSFYHLRGHEVWSAHPACSTDNMSRVSIHSNTFKRAVADIRFEQLSTRDHINQNKIIA